MRNQEFYENIADLHLLRCGVSHGDEAARSLQTASINFMPVGPVSPTLAPSFNAPMRAGENPNPKASACATDRGGMREQQLMGLVSSSSCFSYTPNSVVVSTGQNVELWPPVELLYESLVFAVSSDLPLGLVLEERVGLIHGKPQAGTNGVTTFFVTACDVNGSQTSPLRIAAVQIKVVDLRVAGHSVANVCSPEPGITVVTLKEDRDSRIEQLEALVEGQRARIAALEVEQAAQAGYGMMSL